MKKLLSIIISGSVALSGVPVLCAENTADFSDKLTVLDGLLTECEKAGIPTDYEKINYKVIERFDDYMDDDIANGHMSVDVNLERIDELYNEAKTNLEGYLDGTAVAKNVTQPDMKDINLKGNGFHQSNGMPIYSIGYGHFETAANDVPNFNDFGANNIQLEIGPTNMTDSYLAYVKKVLKNAEKYNIGVNILLSPHYFPSGLDESIYANNDGFIKYNIDAPEAWEVIENYLRTLLPELQGYKSVTGVILSNEPTYKTTNFADFYNPKFREYLENLHGNIENLNSNYGAAYNDFSELEMPDIETVYQNPDNPICYDWVMFNDTIFADWHKRMADIVEEYLPDIPKSIKLQEDYPAHSGTRSMLLHGVDLEMFDKCTDIAGNDAQDYIEEQERYFRTMFMYDYQSSVTEKPVYNSEDHIIKDGSTDFSDNQKTHLRNNLWMGAIHGRDMSTIWVWDRRPNDSALENSILYRPECIAEAGKTSLDLNRLSLYVDLFQKSQPKTAVFYSKASRLYQDYKTYMPKLYEAYKTCLNSGVKVGVVSDSSIEKLSKYDTLIIPNAVYATEETLNAVSEFAENGGNVLYTGDVFSKNEYMKSIDNSAIAAYGTEYASADELGKAIEGVVYLIDEESGERVKNTDWSYAQSGDKLYINISHLEFDAEKNISVYKDGKKLTDLKDLISGTHYSGSVTLTGYTPQLLEYTPNGRKMPEIINPIVDKTNGIISWKSNEDYSGAKIYVLKDGYESYLTTVTGNKFEYTSCGSYIIKPLNSKNKTGNGKRITICDGKPINISVSNFAKLSNTVEMEVSAENTAENYISGLIAVEFYDSRGNRISGAYNGTAIVPNGTETVSFSITVPENAVQVYASFISDKTSQNLYSNEIGYRF